MSGQKGPLYKQSGVAIANRTPFNKNIPNKRQTINDGHATFVTYADGVFKVGDVLPFAQNNEFYTSEVFLFSEDVPTRLRLDLYADTAYSSVTVGSPGVQTAFAVPAMSLSTFGELNATPTLIDGYTAITAANGIQYGQIATGTTETAGVKVRGFASVFSLPVVSQTPVRFQGATGFAETTQWETATLDFSTRSQNTNGYAPYNGTGLAVQKLIIPCVLRETDYTQAIQDAGNRITIGSGFEGIVVGISKTYLID